VCDADSARAERLAAGTGAAVHLDWAAMLGRESMDALCVCVPPFAHDGQEEAAARRGIHLYVAKPIALDCAYAETAADAIDAAGVVSCVSYGLRYAAPVRRALELLQGRPACLAEGRASLRVAPGAGRAWIARKALSRGQLFTQACHLYDVFRLLIGEVREVCAVAARGFIARSDEYDIEDAAVATLRFASGAVGQVSCTVMAPPAASGGIGFRVTARDIELSYTNSEGVLHVVDGRDRWDHDRVAAANDGEKAMLGGFLRAVSTGDRSGVLTPYRDALGSLRVALAADESLQSGRSVALPAPPAG
jgi:predicted dehydrogenase